MTEGHPLESLILVATPSFFKEGIDEHNEKHQPRQIGNPIGKIRIHAQQPNRINQCVQIKQKHIVF